MTKNPIVDRSEINKNIIRACGPFTVEATTQVAQSIDELTTHETEGVQAMMWVNLFLGLCLTLVYWTP